MKSPQMSSKSGGKAHCTVCGDESSGFHYGVDSCEGCKGFFRRCITQGMNHKCTNEEKCEITPFTRNSCQYCRLKKCFQVGMSREASRLGRRPKRLKEVGGESSGGSRSGNLPIAPYPSPQDVNRMRMEELQKILHTGGSLKEDLLQAFVSVAKASFQEHSKTGDKGKGHEVQQEEKPVPMLHTGPVKELASVNSVASSAETRSASVESVGQVSNAVDVDSPSSLHSPGGSCGPDLNLMALDSFLFGQSLPGTPGGSQQMLLDSGADMGPLNSPGNPGSVGLEFVSSATSPVSDIGLGSPLNMPCPASVTNGVGAHGNDSSFLSETVELKNTSVLSPDVTVNSQSTSVPMPQAPIQHQPNLPTPMSTSQSETSSASGDADSKLNIKTDPVKTEPSSDFSSSSASSSSCAVKTEPVSPKTTAPKPVRRHISIFDDLEDSVICVKSILEEVRRTPTETRRLLIEQVTDAVVEAHVLTTLNTRKAIDEANQKIQVDFNKDTENLDSKKVQSAADYMWQQFVSAMVPEITKVVKFCKKLPGFVEIEQDDQICLIKQGAFEVMMTRFALLVDTENETLLDPNLTARCPRRVILATPMGNFLDEFFYVATKFNPLKLTDGEVGLFTSILIVCPTRRGLKNKVSIGKIQSLFQQALYILMKHNHPDAEERFCRLMELVSTFRRINEEHFKAINNIRLVLPDRAQFPDLHREIFDGSH